MEPKEELKQVTTTYVDGNKCEEYFVNEKGDKEGLYIKYDPDGNKIKELTYDCGQFHGVRKQWNSREKEPYWTAEYQHGILHGKFIYIGVDGVREERKYQNNKLHQIVSLTDKNGNNCALPEGNIEVFKACRAICDSATGKYTNVYVKLLVSADALRVTPRNDDDFFKARISKGVVVEIVDEKGNKYDRAESTVHRENILIYEMNKEVTPDKFDDSLEVSCTNGIHVHLQREHCKRWFKNFDEES
jgi:hypothetical protein